MLSDIDYDLLMSKINAVIKRLDSIEERLVEIEQSCMLQDIVVDDSWEDMRTSRD